MVDLPEHFESDRLLMRRFRAGDETWIFDYASNPEVTQYMDWPAHRNVSDSVAYIRMTEADWSSGSQYAWAVTRKADSTPIGAIGCSAVTHKVSFGYVFARHAWGNGYATEASQALHHWLAQVEDLQRIWAVCDIDNVASARVLTKLGLKQEGILRKWKIRPNMPGQPARDSIMFSKMVDD